MTEEPSAAVVYLDAMTFIFLVEGKPSVLEPVKALFEGLRTRPGAGVTKEAHGKKLSLPDSIHLVTAIRRRCRYFVSADKGIRPPVNMMKRVAPDADGVAELLKVLT